MYPISFNDMKMITRDISRVTCRHRVTFRIFSTTSFGIRSSTIEITVIAGLIISKCGAAICSFALIVTILEISFNFFYPILFIGSISAISVECMQLGDFV